MKCAKFIYLLAGVKLCIGMAQANTVLPSSADAHDVQVAALQPEKPVRSDRFVYVNDRLVGLFDVCTNSTELNRSYFGEGFFERVGLRAASESIECDGKRFFMLTIPVLRNEAARTLRIDGVAEKDFARFVDSGRNDDESASQGSNGRSKIPHGEPILLPQLAHSVSAWGDSSNRLTLAAQLDGHLFTENGMFLAEGSFASDNGATSSQLRNIGWKRHLAQWDADASIGVLSPQLVSSGLSITGAMLTSDAGSEQASMIRRIEGFAEVPGRIQIRSGGVLLKEFPVPVGNFSVPTPPSQSNIYTLTLVDESGAAVRSWESFVPNATRALAGGAQRWGAFAGQINTEFNSNGFSLQSDNLGAGGYLRRGMGAGLTLEGSAYSSALSWGSGVGFDYEALPWLSFYGSTTKSRTINQLTVSSHNIGASASYEGVGANLSLLNTDCYVATGAMVGLSAFDAERSRCTSAQAGGVFRLGKSSSLSLRRTDNITGPSLASTSLQFTTSLNPNIALSTYGSQTIQSGYSNYSIGLTLHVSLGAGQFSSGYQSSGPNTDSATLNYSDSIDKELRYNISAMTPLGDSRMGSHVGGGMHYMPWYGIFSANVNQSSTGATTVGLSESGAVALVDGYLLPTRPSASGYAVIKLPDLPNTAIEDSAGYRKAVTNEAGLAVLPVTRGETHTLHVAAEDLPLDLKMSTSLMGVAKEDWQALAWKTVTQQVRPGWARLVKKGSGAAVQIGSMIRLEGVDEPSYVLNDGEVYFSDLPAMIASFEVRYPGDEGRCVVIPAAKMELTPNINGTKVELTCVESTAAN